MSPLLTLTDATVPSWGARISFSIFMASRITSTSPALTEAPALTLTSRMLPVSYEKGFPIHGLENFKNKDGYYVFHAGTKQADGQIVTNGGRVLGVTAVGPDLKTARANAYEAVKLVSFEKAFYRSDIGKAIDEA